MTKLTQTGFSALLAKEDPSVKAVLFYGQDEGLIEECRQKMTAAVVPDSKDPFRIVDMTQAQVRDDIALLYDEANAVSLTGGRRVIRFRGVDNNFASVMKEFLSDYKGDSLVVITGGNLTTKGALPQLFEKAANARVMACYPDEGGALKQFVFQTLQENGFDATPEALNFIADNLGADRMLSRSELSKLMAYMGRETHISAEDAMACVGNASALSVDQMVYALGNGNQKELHETLDRLYAEGELPITLLRAAANHFKRLHLVVGKTAQGTALDAAMRSLFPPVHFKRTDDFKRQTRLWALPKIGRALSLLAEAERECKRPGRPQELICARVFLQIAAQAKR